MDRELNEHVMIERVEMIARLAAESTCQEKDREIAPGLIADLAKDKLLKEKIYSVIFSASSFEN